MHRGGYKQGNGAITGTAMDLVHAWNKTTGKLISVNLCGEKQFSR